MVKLNCRNCDAMTSLVHDNFCAKCFAYMKRNKDRPSITATLISLKSSLTEAVKVGEPSAVQLDSLLKIPTLSKPETKQDAPCYFHLLLTLEVFLHHHSMAGYFAAVYKAFQKMYELKEVVPINLHKLLLVQTSVLSDLKLYRGNILTLPNKSHPLIAEEIRTFILAMPLPSPSVQDALFRRNHCNIVACTLILSLAAPEHLTEGMAKLYLKLEAYVKSSYDAKLYLGSTEQPLSQLLNTLKE